MNRITDQTDEFLKETGSMYNLFLNEVTDYAIITLSLEGNIKSWNAGAEMIKGYTAKEIIGKHFSIFYPIEELQKKFPQYELEVVKKEGRFEDEGWRVKKDGSFFWANVVITALFDKGNIIGFSKITRNLTERKNAEEQLKAVNNELEAFSYSISHDLRAPLRAIVGYSNILIEDYTDKLDDEGRRVLNVIMKNAVKMGQLIDDLLAFSRIGKQNLIKVNIDLGSLVKTIVSELNILQSNKIEMDVKSLLSAKCDSSMMKQVIVNLIGNAIKYSNKKETSIIEIGSYREINENIYYIKDNGAGFDMKYYDKLFGVFQRLHNDKEFEGTGVGLALVKRIITKHGGKTWAEAKVDEGATFYFSLPNI